MKNEISIWDNKIISQALIDSVTKWFDLAASSHATTPVLQRFPGGKREPNEPFEECLKRELREELGIEVKVGSLFEMVTHDYDDRLVHLQFFCCRWLRHEPQLLDCADFKWIERHQLAEYAFPAADAQLVERLQNSTELWRIDDVSA